MSIIEYPSLTPELNCENLDGALGFYVDILRFKVLHRDDKSGFAMIQRQDSVLTLQEIRENSHIYSSAPMQKPYGRGVCIQIKTRDVEMLYNRCLDHKYSIHLKLEEEWRDLGEVKIGVEHFIVRDPDGYWLRFFEEIDTRPVDEEF